MARACYPVVEEDTACEGSYCSGSGQMFKRSLRNGSTQIIWLRDIGVMVIFHQPTPQHRGLRLSDPYDKGKLDIFVSPGNFPASSRGEVDASHKELIVRRPAGYAR